MRTLLIMAILLVGAVSSADARGRSYTSDGHVAHSRLAPVIFHRAIPGGGGVHEHRRLGWILGINNVNRAPLLAHDDPAAAVAKVRQQDAAEGFALAGFAAGCEERRQPGIGLDPNWVISS